MNGAKQWTWVTADLDKKENQTWCVSWYRTHHHSWSSLALKKKKKKRQEAPNVIRPLDSSTSLLEVSRTEKHETPSSKSILQETMGQIT